MKYLYHQQLGQRFENYKSVVLVFGIMFSCAGCDASLEVGNAAFLGPDVRATALFSEVSPCEASGIDISGTRLHGKIGHQKHTPLKNLETPIPAGEYSMKLYYEDQLHIDPDQPDQLHEIWFAELFDESGNLVLVTPETTDLPVDEIQGSTHVGVHYIDSDIYSIRGVHAYESGEFNSIQPTVVELTCHSDPVKDIIPPVITLLGANPLFVDAFSGYSDPGATAIDNIDGDLTAEIVVGEDTVDVIVPGTYFVTYDVTDTAGNKAVQVVREVIVVPVVAKSPEHSM